MQYEDIILQKEGSIATLTLNRPQRMNAVSARVREELPAALAEVQGDENIRVLILTGAGDRAFCAGADAEFLGARAAGDVKEATRRQVTMRMGWYVPQFRESRVPTIAAVNGVAVGIGLSYALACDIRIASDKARFGCAWVSRGLTPDGGATYLLPQIVGVEKALELFFTGEMINAEEALRIGLVSRVVPHDELMKATKGLAERLAAGPPIAIELAKYGVYKGLGSDIKGAIDYENYAARVSTGTEDFKEGVRSFMEKRKAEFKGY